MALRVSARAYRLTVVHAQPYRQRRLDAQAAGQPSASYTAVRSRLRKAVATAAGDAAPIITRVFGGELMGADLRQTNF